jgi:hypothetical protein
MSLAWILRPGAECSLRQLLEADPIDPFSDRDLNVLTIADLASEDAGSALPVHGIAGTPDRLDSKPKGRVACVTRFLLTNGFALERGCGPLAALVNAGLVRAMTYLSPSSVMPLLPVRLRRSILCHGPVR